ncbi:MAG: GNAT family N-acetyltransferase, partial [Rhodanobacteraceae bacterium]
RYVYFAVREGARLLGAAPGFITNYRLDTTVQGGLRRVTEAAARVFPKLLNIPMLALGSPVTERCRVGFVPDATLEQQVAWLDQILTRMEAFAGELRLGMLAIKDAPRDEPIWQRVCPRHGLRALPGLPGATLDITWRDLDGYLAALGPATRKDLRRKWRARGMLGIAWRSDIDGVADDMQRLYRETLAHAELSFEELTPAYFENVLRNMPGRAFCVTYREHDRLVAFNLVLQDGRRLLDKFLGMDYAAMDRYNLYHVSWLENIRHCVDEGLAVYASGQGMQQEKMRLGSTLHRNALWYRHRNRFLDGVFARVERLAWLDHDDGSTPGSKPAPSRVHRA